MSKAAFRDIPSVDRVLTELALAGYRREVVTGAVRAHIDRVRAAAARGAAVPSAAAIAASVAESMQARWTRWPAPVLNATGVILHTNLGRAPLSEESLRAVVSAGGRYADLEIDLKDGKRGSRHAASAKLLRQLIGAEDAIVVNNNAGGVLLGLAAVAAGRDVVVSRGEASEIGGGFRIPDVLAQSGARLVEVGTVNRTYDRDYARAITENTGALLLVHRSNFQVVGFTHEPALAEVASVGAAHRIPVLHDLGAGTLLDTAEFGIGHEPTPQESLAQGSGLVFFSGDKLLGGPQAGIVAGRAELVAKLRAHPLARALRADKLTLAALHETLLHYARGEAKEKIPVWRMLAASADDLDRRACAIAAGVGTSASVVDGVSTVGGGSLPADALPTRLVSIDAAEVGGPNELARRLRTGSPAVVARIENDRVLLDPRTVPPALDADLTAALLAVLA